MASVLVTFSSSAFDGQDGDFRDLRNRQGNVIEARILSVSSDLKEMKISRRDGREFKISPLEMDLDSQQYIKQWVAANPVSIDYRLDVSTELRERTTQREKDDYYDYRTERCNYVVTIKNLTRETVPETFVEYVFCLEDGARIYNPEAGSTWAWTEYNPPERKLVRGRVEMQELPYNHEFRFESDPHEVEKIQVDNTVYAEDRILGIRVRIRTKSGALIGEFGALDGILAGQSWEEVTGDEPIDPKTVSESRIEPGSQETQLEEWPREFQYGEFLKPHAIPDPVGKSLKVSGFARFESPTSEGVMVAHGGLQKGWTIFLKDERIHFMVKVYRDRRTLKKSVSIPVAVVGTSEFSFRALWSKDLLALEVGESGPISEDSPGLLETKPSEGISVGFDSENTTVAPIQSPARLAGDVMNVTIEFVD